MRGVQIELSMTSSSTLHRCQKTKNHYGCSLGAFGFRYGDGEQKEMLCKACNTQVTTSLCKLPSQTPLSFPSCCNP